MTVRAGSAQVLDTFSIGGWPTKIAFDAERHRAFISLRNSPNLWVVDTDTHQLLKAVRIGAGQIDVAFDPQSNRAFTTWGGHYVSVIDGETLTVSATFYIGNGGYPYYAYPSYIAVDGAQRRLYITHDVPAGTISVVDADTYQLLNTIVTNAGSTTGVAYDTTRNLAYAVAYNRTLHAVDGRTMELAWTLGNVGAGVVRIDAGTGRVYVGSNGFVEGTPHVTAVDPDARRVIGNVVIGADSIAIDPNRGRVYASNYWGNVVTVVDRPLSEVLGSFRFPAHLAAISFDAPTGLLWVTDELGTIYVVNDNIGNTAPTADSQAFTVLEDTPQPIILTASDPDGDAITYEVQTYPVHGTVTGIGPNLTYSPHANYFGPDSFTFKVSDGERVSNPATVSIDVQPVNDAPTADAGGAYIVAEGASVVLSANGGDIEDATLSYAWDLNGDGSFETPGRTVTFAAASLDGPALPVVAVRVTDSEGLSAIAGATVNVLNVIPTVGPITWTTSVDPGRVNAPLTATATVTDPGVADTHTATWNWGDGSTSAGTVSNGIATGTHAYTTAGFYTVTLTVTDDDGGSALPITYATVVVVNPAAGGTVSGSGTVASPAGAYPSDPAVGGSATFTISAKYRKGATVPSGTTSFHHSAAGLSFSSSSYKWLLSAGGKAWYRGTGVVTINGISEAAEFLVAAVDGPTYTPDMLRVRIWTATRTVYDSQPGAPDSAYATPDVTSGPGSIVVW